MAKTDLAHEPFHRLSEFKSLVRRIISMLARESEGLNASKSHVLDYVDPDLKRQIMYASHDAFAGNA